MKPRPSIRDIADCLGVSHTTVSLALRNHPRITSAMRRRVRMAAKEVGYHADSTISTLMARLRNIRTHSVQETLGFLTAWSTHDGWRQWQHHLLFFQAARRRAKELGYGLDEFWLREPGMTAKRMTSILRSRGVRGLVAFSLEEPEGRLSLGWEHFSCVTKGLTVVRPAMHRVISSHYDDIRLAVGKLRQRGYRRLGLVLSERLSQRVGHAWLAGYYLYQHEELSRRDWVPVLFVPPAAGEAKFMKWCTSHRPDVILFADQPVQTWTKRLGLEVPQDVGLVDLTWTTANPNLTGIDSDPLAQGSAAIELLVGQLQANEKGVPLRPKVVEVIGKWVPGGTIR